MQDPPINTALFEHLAKGDEQAFRQVFHYYTPRLQPFVFNIVKSEAVAEEIVQDVFMKLWINREVVAEKDNPSSWLFTVAAHQALSFLRRVAVERRFIDSVKQKFQEAPGANPTEELLYLREDEVLLEKALEKLPPQQKLIFGLSRKEGLSHKEIAGQLNISPHTVKNHIVTAIRSIRAFIHKSSSIFFSSGYFFIFFLFLTSRTH